jgi:hypothetical protein
LKSVVFYEGFFHCTPGGKPPAKKRYTLLSAMPDIGWFTLEAW